MVSQPGPPAPAVAPVPGALLPWVPACPRELAGRLPAFSLNSGTRPVHPTLNPLSSHATFYSIPGVMKHDGPELVHSAVLVDKPASDVYPSVQARRGWCARWTEAG